MSRERELLRRALNHWDYPALDKQSFGDLFEEIRAYLAAEPEDKPVVFRYKEDPFDGRSAWLYTTKQKFIPVGHPYEKLFRNPPRPEPARKPMTEEEIQKHSIFWLLYDQKSFVAGIRFAEKHHGIGDQNG